MVKPQGQQVSVGVGDGVTVGVRVGVMVGVGDGVVGQHVVVNVIVTVGVALGEGVGDSVGVGLSAMAGKTARSKPSPAAITMKPNINFFMALPSLSSLHNLRRPRPQYPVLHRQDVPCIGPHSILVGVPAGVVLLGIFHRVEDAQLTLGDVTGVDTEVTVHIAGPGCRGGGRSGCFT